MSARLPQRLRSLLTSLGLLAALLFAPSAQGAEVLEVRLDDDVAGGLLVGVRNAEGAVPEVTIGETKVTMQKTGADASLRWQPLLILVDTTNMPAEVLDRVKTNVENVVKAQFDGGSQLVVVVDGQGNKFELKKADTAMRNLKDFMARWEPVPAPDKMKYAPSTAPEYLRQGLASLLVPRGKPWALVYSSLCVPEDAEKGDYSAFKGPLTFLTWNVGVDPSCQENRAKWLTASAGDNVSAVHIDKAEDKAKLEAALSGVKANDALMQLSGWEYDGGNFTMQVGFPGEEDKWNGSFTEEVVPQSWLDAASKRRQNKSKLIAAAGLSVLVALLIVVAIIKARSGAAEVAKWEAVGEAEDLSAEMDPDAWNATIFQLTGAMPVLKDVQAAAQLGPAKKGENAKATVQSTPEELTGGTPPEAGTTAPAKPTGIGPNKETGMTVAVPVQDDGTGYEAESPFEVGVLLDGKPVARKTKKFRKVFSIGRATDNRVVIQKDDTVHRYHVVVRPAMEGKEWWLEVSPTASNRTNLNGKDLKAGGRYRLPARFRLQLGELTEVRGRMTE